MAGCGAAFLHGTLRIRMDPVPAEHVSTCARAAIRYFGARRKDTQYPSQFDLSYPSLAPLLESPETSCAMSSTPEEKGAQVCALACLPESRHA